MPTEGLSRDGQTPDRSRRGTPFQGVRILHNRLQKRRVQTGGEGGEGVDSVPGQVRQIRQQSRKFRKRRQRGREEEGPQERLKHYPVQNTVCGSQSGEPQTDPRVECGITQEPPPGRPGNPRDGRRGLGGFHRLFPGYPRTGDGRSPKPRRRPRRRTALR